MNIAEVVASSISGLTAATKYLNQHDNRNLLGCLIKTDSADCASLAIIANIEYIPSESNRTVSPLGMNKEVLKREMSHLFELVSVNYTAITVGYQLGGRVQQGFALAPPELHEFVFLADEKEQQAFLDAGDYFLRLVLNAPDSPSGDEIIVAFMRRYKTIFTTQRLDAIGRELSFLLSHDSRRLESLLLRIST